MPFSSVIRIFARGTPAPTPIGAGAQKIIPRSAHAAPWSRPGIGLVIVLAAALLPYANTLENDFIGDDVAIVSENPLIRDPRAIPELFRRNYWAPIDHSNLYRPVTLASYAVNRALTGPGPRGFHAVNVLLHAAVSALLYALVRVLGGGGLAALAAGVVFAVHPLHTEAVTQVVGRADLLAAAFALAALALHARGGGRGPHPRRGLRGDGVPREGDRARCASRVGRP